MLGLGRRTGGNGHIPSSDLPPRQQAEKRRVLLKWILHCGSMLLYPTILDLYMLTDEQVTLTEFFMQNKVTTERGQWWSALCLALHFVCSALHFVCSGLLRLYSMWEGGRTETDNVRWDNAHKGQHGGFRLNGRKKFLEEKHSLGAGYWRGYGNSALWGFMAQKRKPSSPWSGLVKALHMQEGDHWASGSSLQTAFWTGSKSKLYLYIKQLYPI